MKYIDAEKLNSLIDNKLEDLGMSGSVWVGRSVLCELKDEIKSIQQEQPIQVDTLTWKDINDLERIINNVHYEFRNGISEKGFGEEVLERFMEERDEQEQPIKVYRVENEKEQKGIWRKFDGTWEPLFDMLTDGQCKDMPMDDNPIYREGGKQWFASAPSKETLQKWFSKRDLEELTAKGFTISEFEVVGHKKISDFEYIFTRDNIISRTYLKVSDIYPQEQPSNVKSPFTGGKVAILSRQEEVTFRGEKVKILRKYYHCKDTGKEFTDSKLDNDMMWYAFRAYCEKKGMTSFTDIMLKQEQPEMDLEKEAQAYSFNIESMLFFQLSKEQQILWKKEIEQAFLAGQTTRMEWQEQLDADLEKDDIIDYIHEHFYYDKDFDGYGHGKFRPVFTREDLIKIARHFYELGKKQ